MRYGLLIFIGWIGCCSVSYGAFDSTSTKGNCSPIINGGSVTITCIDIPEKALAQLNELLNSPEKWDQVYDSARTIRNLNDSLETKDEKLHRTELTLQEKTAEAEKWAQGYKELESRLQAEDDNELSKQALTALQAGDLNKAGELLDKLIAQREQTVDKLASDHFNRAKVFELQFKPIQALQHAEKAYHYRPENTEYAHKYAMLLQQQNQCAQAITIYEQNLQRLREAGDRANVASTLNNLGLLYSDTQRLKEGKASYQEALTTYQDLAKANLQTYSSYVAMTLNNLSILYQNTQQLEEGETSLQETLTIYQDLAKANSQAYLPYVATTLNNLGILYKNMQRFEEGEASYQEALTIYRDLAKANSQAYLPYVATTLNNLGNLYQVTQRLNEGETSYQEALTIRRDLAKNNPQAYSSYVATTLTSLGVPCSDTQQLKEAEDLADTLLKIVAIYFEQGRKSLPTARDNLRSLHRRDTQRFKEKEAHYQEALTIYRYLAKANPQAHRKDLADTLRNMALLYYMQDKIAEVRRYSNEAILLYRELWQAYPDDTHELYVVPLSVSLLLNVLTYSLGEETGTHCVLLREVWEVIPLKLKGWRGGGHCELPRR